jgi:hypothetical protein
VNGLPDVIYLYVTFPADEFVELYGVRKDIKRNWRFRKMFMEDVAKEALEYFKKALSVEVRLATGRHTVLLVRQKALIVDEPHQDITIKLDTRDVQEYIACKLDKIKIGDL